MGVRLIPKGCALLQASGMASCDRLSGPLRLRSPSSRRFDTPANYADFRTPAGETSQDIFDAAVPP
jgi:hypothetical protein